MNTPAEKKEPDCEFLNHINSIIVDNLTMDGLGVSFIADSMCMSPSTLFRKVKANTGTGINEYIRNVRLERVVKILTDEREKKNVAICDAAFSCGFSSLSSFAKAFKKKYGVSATRYIEGNNKAV